MLDSLQALRRVYAEEFRALLGCGPTWLRKLERDGAIPAARTDPGARRKWWTAAEVEAVLERLNREAVPAGATRAAPEAANAATRGRRRSAARAA